MYRPPEYATRAYLERSRVARCSRGQSRAQYTERRVLAFKQYHEGYENYASRDKILLEREPVARGSQWILSARCASERERVCGECAWRVWSCTAGKIRR